MQVKVVKQIIMTRRFTLLTWLVVSTIPGDCDSIDTMLKDSFKREGEKWCRKISVWKGVSPW